MKKLYDEIMDKQSEFYGEDYGRGFNNGIKEAADLAKKYDAEIERLNQQIVSIRQAIRDETGY